MINQRHPPLYGNFGYPGFCPSRRTPPSEDFHIIHKFPSRSNGTPLLTDRIILDHDTSPSFYRNRPISIGIMSLGLVDGNFPIGGYGPASGKVPRVRALWDVRKLVKDTCGAVYVCYLFTITINLLRVFAPCSLLSLAVPSIFP